MLLGKLGEQIMLKSHKAFDNIQFIDYEIADGKKYYPLRKERFNNAKKQYEETLEQNDISGIFIRDLILGEVKADDPRLR